MLNEAKRAWIYRIATAVVGLLLVLGVLTDVIAESSLFLIAAILGLGEGGLASLNTSTRSTNE